MRKMISQKKLIFSLYADVVEIVYNIYKSLREIQVLVRRICLAPQQGEYYEETDPLKTGRPEQE